MSEQHLRVGAGYTLLLDGPASIRVLKGSASILGCRLRRNRSYLMRPYRRYPVTADEELECEVRLGDDGGLKIVEGDTVGKDWMKLASSLERGCRVLVMGGFDTGKTSLSTLLANRLSTLSGCAILCLDPGQSYLSPPTTVGGAFLREPVHDLSQLEASAVVPVCSTSAPEAAEMLIRAAGRLVQWVEKMSAPSLVVDVDGWVEGQAAEEAKSRLVELFRPTDVAFLGDALPAVGETAKRLGSRIHILQRPRAILERSQNMRREIRAMAYRRFLRNASLKTIPITWIRLETSSSDPETLLRRVSEALTTTKAGSGLLSYISGGDEYLYRIGLITGYEPGKNLIRIYTAMNQSVRNVFLGRMLVTQDGEEIGYI
ncbi:hypothetical protein HRbin01_00872 [archaeon HR01]|nr:hypothetical protein HRbin01_00872 [archaeon HR01]